MPISIVEDGLAIEPEHVYLIPPGKEMIVSDGRLLLSDRDPQTELTLPVDVFFRSLAQDCGPRAVAVVLSGGGTDGSRGIRDVHAAGGLVIVQDVQSAQFDGMPRAAVETGDRRRGAGAGADAGGADRPRSRGAARPPAPRSPPSSPKGSRPSTRCWSKSSASTSPTTSPAP